MDVMRKGYEAIAGLTSVPTLEEHKQPFRQGSGFASNVRGEVAGHEGFE